MASYNLKALAAAQMQASDTVHRLWMMGEVWEVLDHHPAQLASEALDRLICEEGLTWDHDEEQGYHLVDWTCPEEEANQD